MMTKDLDALEWKMPAGVRRRRKRAMKAVLEFEND